MASGFMFPDARPSADAVSVGNFLDKPLMIDEMIRNWQVLDGCYHFAISTDRLILSADRSFFDRAVSGREFTDVGGRIGLVDHGQMRAFENFMKPSESVRTFLVERRASDGHWLCRAGTFDHQGSNVNCLSIRLARTPQEAKFADLSLAFGLTRSESEVLGALMLGNSPRTAGERLGVSINTVRTHVRHVHEKLDVSDPYSLLCKLSAYRLR